VSSVTEKDHLVASASAKNVWEEALWVRYVQSVRGAAKVRVTPAKAPVEFLSAKVGSSARNMTTALTVKAWGIQNAHAMSGGCERLAQPVPVRAETLVVPTAEGEEKLRVLRAAAEAVYVQIGRWSVSRRKLEIAETKSAGRKMKSNIGRGKLGIKATYMIKVTFRGEVMKTISSALTRRFVNCSRGGKPATNELCELLPLIFESEFVLTYSQ
jgi:hypothetical protein